MPTRGACPDRSTAVRAPKSWSPRGENHPVPETGATREPSPQRWRAPGARRRCLRPAGRPGTRPPVPSSISAAWLPVQVACPLVSHVITCPSPARTPPGVRAAEPDASARHAWAPGGAWSAPPARAPRAVRPVHRAPIVCREPITVHVHDVHVAGANGDALLHDARALVHQRVQHPIEHFLIRDLAPLDATIETQHRS